jgi:hypothetical protein
MPRVGNSYAMNPAVAKRKARDNGEVEEPDQDEAGGASDNDDDDLIPPGHELDEIRVKPAENGFTVNHTTRMTKEERAKRDKAKGKGGEGLYSSDDYRGKDRVFESHAGAAGHVLKVMAAHRKGKGKK